MFSLKKLAFVSDSESLPASETDLNLAFAIKNVACFRGHVQKGKPKLLWDSLLPFRKNNEAVERT